MNLRTKLPSFCLLNGVVILIAACCGCSSDYKYVPVTGELKFEDGSIIQGESVSLVFKPQVEAVSEDSPPGDGIAYVSDDGSFDSAYTATNDSSKPADGIVAGKHHVLVIATGPDGRSVVPNEYTKEDQTPLRISTEDPQPFSFRVPKRE